ncbi:citrate lyase beta subunit [Actinophytocola algeriensis]|uniref:Citrate lyase beta subunit n=1 Tax=Actinophytocola algeriensis TaxID=1768010 RepID=A0A7W7QA37_9PSEU|nr:citrate lyase beta subunit [Actinophytocola algeriensis]MBE1475835.1 citrate lyase beta subunit [Actinophytocola algeriensis]
MIERARSFLFVPGDRPDRFAKAAAAGADVVVLDLEDAVAPGAKDAAREHVVAWLAEGHTAVVRINAAGTPWHAADLAAVRGAAAAGCAPPVDGVTMALSDVDVVREDTRHAVELGFTGKLCVHPRQVPVVHEAFRPTEDEIAWPTRSSRPGKVSARWMGGWWTGRCCCARGGCSAGADRTCVSYPRGV